MKITAIRFPVLLLLLAPLVHARPEFLVRYATDPFSRSEKQECGTCHLNPKGGGTRNAFGQAFARNGFRITQELRQEFPDRFQTVKSTPEVDAQGQKVKATWSATKENEMVLEIGDSKYLLNRADGTMQKIDVTQAQAFVQPPAPVAPAPERPVDDLDTRVRATFDNYLVDLPTNRPRPKGSFSFRFSHRFQLGLTEKTGAARDLFGLDGNSVSSFGLEYGITKWLSALTYRSPLNGNAKQTVELGFQVYALEQGVKKSPLSLSFRTTVEGQENFGQRHTFNFQPVLSRAFGTRVEVFLVPTFDVGVPRRSLTFVDFFPQGLESGEKKDNQIAVGNGISIRIRPRVALVAEWVPRVDGFRLRGTSNTYSVAIQRKTNRHVFALVFSNNNLSTTTRMVSDGRGDPRIGFNIYRRIW